MLISTEIILEYEEVIGRHMGLDITNDVLSDLDQFHNVSLINLYYRWNLIHNDWDDNKFIDCAIAGNADCIVTNDKHLLG
ncbi:MAG: putative toxin-antitoxin system toxin component, PIN family [Bacteroidetes bacterium]|nr:putative toxin-antitoxin system toxin component, PIN family [Bacteroidota bacterium]MCY4225894.1 putative toxin-antitoxin system toxin component, PIN family [Bacteroidota bacterium]